MVIEINRDRVYINGERWEDDSKYPFMRYITYRGTKISIVCSDEPREKIELCEEMVLESGYVMLAMHQKDPLYDFGGMSVFKNINRQAGDITMKNGQVYALTSRWIDVELLVKAHHNNRGLAWSLT